MKTYTIAAIPGDGIGQKVIAADVEALAAIARSPPAGLDPAQGRGARSLS